MFPNTPSIASVLHNILVHMLASLPHAIIACAGSFCLLASVEPSLIWSCQSCAKTALILGFPFRSSVFEFKTALFIG